jgi:stage V sporulation protein D (sporulation-specific penicillin-binding protein)
VPNVLNYPVEEAENALRTAGFTAQKRGSGEIVANQVPAAGASVKRGSAVLLEMREIDPEDEITVPDLSGLTIKEAGSLLEKLGLALMPTGNGFAYEQFTSPGNKVSKGTAIPVVFSDIEIKTLRD